MKEKKQFLSKKQSTNLSGSRWLVTVHGARPDGSCPHLSKLKQEFQKDEYTLAAVGYETGVHGIHPHWQIYFQTAERCRMKQKLCELLGEDVGLHIQLAKGTKNACLKYIYATNKSYEIGWVHYAKGHVPPASYDPRISQDIIWFQNNMKPWQVQVVQKLKQPPDYRDIVWVYEPKGNSGKTRLAKYLHFLHGAIVTGGTSADMKYAIARWRQITGHYPVTIIVDLARSDSMTASGYASLEQIKNGLFFSGKYESGMVASLSAPHVIVFANRKPQVSYMSRDRWLIYKINPDTYELNKQKV